MIEIRLHQSFLSFRAATCSSDVEGSGNGCSDSGELEFVKYWQANNQGWGADVVFGEVLTLADGSRTLLLAKILDILGISQYYIYNVVAVGCGKLPG